jgi:hypothetical protein
MVIPVDLDAGQYALNGDSSCFGDGLHLNDKGHAKAAQTMLAAARNAGVDMAAQAPYLALTHLPRPYRMSPLFQNSWGDFDPNQTGTPPSQLAGYYRDPRTGIVYFEGAIARSGSPVVGEVIFYLPPGFKPPGGQQFTVDNNTTSPGAVVVNPDGSVTYKRGGGAYLDLSSIRFRANTP